MSMIRSPFAKPAFIEALGEEGLTAHQIAQSLGVSVREVHKKLKRGNWKPQDMQQWRVVPHGTANDTNGLLIDSFALNDGLSKRRQKELVRLGSEICKLQLVK